MKLLARSALGVLLSACLLSFSLPPASVHAQLSQDGLTALEYVQGLRTTNFYVRSAMEQLEARGWAFQADKCLRTVSPEGTEVVYITYSDGDPNTWEGVIWTAWANESLTAIGQSRVDTGEVVSYTALDAPAEEVTPTSSAAAGDETASNTLMTDTDFELVLDTDPCIEDKKWECEQQFESAQSQLRMYLGLAAGTCVIVGAGTAAIGGVACIGFSSLGIIAASRRNRAVYAECLRRVPSRCPRPVSGG